jgi:hypothetical protein
MGLIVMGANTRNRNRLVAPVAIPYPGANGKAYVRENRLSVLTVPDLGSSHSITLMAPTAVGQQVVIHSSVNTGLSTATVNITSASTGTESSYTFTNTVGLVLRLIAITENRVLEWRVLFWNG